jgi:L-lactate dehydrogenase complex protein LldF
VAGRLGRGRAMPGGRRALAWLPWPGSRWTQARDLPLPPRESFRSWWRRVGRKEGQR